MDPIIKRLALILTLVVFTPKLFGQDFPEVVESLQQGRLPYEVIVTPTVKRSDLRKLIVQVEEDFFQKFNELNIDENYDVTCYKYIPTMSHIPERVCEPHFMMEARGANVSEVVFGLGGPPGSGGKAPNGILLPPKAMRMSVADQYEILQQKMEDLNASDIELRSIGLALAKLKARLENFGKE